MKPLNELVACTINPSVPPPTPSEILEYLKAYPSFTLLAKAWLRRTAEEGMLYDSGARKQIALRVAMASGNIDKSLLYTVYDMAEGDETDDGFYPEDEVLQPDTSDTIDIFLSHYSGHNDTTKETEILEKLIFNPTPDYASILSSEEQGSLPSPNDAVPGSDDDLINRFILAEQKDSVNVQETENTAPPSFIPVPVPSGAKIEKPARVQEYVSLSESLAKIYIRKKNYLAAKEIISKLNLNYPEKSIYFAVQLRFLDKLLLNEHLLGKSGSLDK